VEQPLAVDWADVGHRVRRLRGSPGADRVFGAAGGHGFELLPPLTSAEVAGAEAQLGISLPADYRAFLLGAGAGGAGPYYGLFPLVRDAAGAWGWRALDIAETDLTRLAEPFDPGPRLEAMAHLWASAPPYVTGAGGAEYRAWSRAWEETLDDPRLTTGAIGLCHEGCAYVDWLVVSGPRRGEIWFDGRPADGPVEPRLDEAGQPVTFAGWYLQWLSEAEATAW